MLLAHTYGRSLTYALGMDHDENVIAAAALTVADRIRSAVEAAAGRGGGGAAVLTTLHAWADGQPIEQLAGALGLSHSRAVRVIDGLVEDGLVRRGRDPADARRALIKLTAAGRRTCAAMLSAREAALGDAIAGLDGAQRDALVAVSEVLVADATTSRREARRICRFCDTRACGHEDGRCPSTRRADELEAQQAT